MMTFSKRLLNFTAEVNMASLHMPVYWSSASEIFFMGVISLLRVSRFLKRRVFIRKALCKNRGKGAGREVFRSLLSVLRVLSVSF